MIPININKLGTFKT